MIHILIAVLSLVIYGPYNAEVLKVIDGDTLKVSVATWPGQTQIVNLRLDGINTPESRRPAPDCERIVAAKAKGFVKGWVEQYDNKVLVTNIHPGKYAGRMLGNVIINGRDLGELLVRAKLAKEYHGGKRVAWCED